MQKKSKILARAGVISALYVVLSMVVFPFASGSIQVRLGEALTILPLFFPEACISLFIGCIIVNFITGCALIDVVFGALVTLISAVLTLIIGRIIKNNLLKLLIGGSFPILLNAFLLPLLWYWCYGQLEYVYILQVLFVFLGQTASVYALGGTLFFGLDKYKEKLNLK
ncbi:MAG: QueT transporter family protein [Clostridia bacterium]|nr:QueT transporter family protein [Clostridia bacterium]